MIGSKADWQYLKYVLKHKWYVFVAGFKLGVPVWNLLIHDLSKFSRAEWTPYVNKFYRGIKNKEEFTKAFEHHWKNNPHHPQYWCQLHEPLMMPETYAREMVADWIGAGIAITGRNDIIEWYDESKGTIELHPSTRVFVETIIPGYIEWVISNSYATSNN